MINREIDRRTPTIEATGEIPRPTQAPRQGVHGKHAATQKGRDRAATLGCAGVVLVVLTILACVAAVLFRVWVDHVEGEALAKPMDGSTAGANAVTAEELLAREARGEWEDGAWSVTKEDLEREYELDAAYPLNGKKAALTANTTYNRGAGMVDLITYDMKTNAMIRHYGQLDQFGNVRWYAAETVLDADGRPRIMPTE
jgi:hypothetical protein